MVKTSKNKPSTFPIGVEKRWHPGEISSCFPWRTRWRWSPRTARRSAARPGATSTAWRRSSPPRRGRARPRRRRRREGLGTVAVFPVFFQVFSSVSKEKSMFSLIFSMVNRGFPRFFRGNIEIFRKNMEQKTTKSRSLAGLAAMKTPWRLAFWGWNIGFNGFIWHKRMWIWKGLKRNG